MQEQSDGSDDMENREHYLISVDGGGTKTEYCAESLETGRLFSSIYGGANYKSSSEQIARENIVGGYHDFLTRHSIPQESVQIAVFGFSGCDTHKDLALYRDIVAETGLGSERAYVYNDSELVLRALADEGICVVAGTGSIAMGLTSSGRKVRVGGWGVPLSDEGSGWWMGAEVLKRYLRWCDNLGPKVPYFDRITHWLGAESSSRGVEMAAVLSNQEIASLAQDIMDYAAKGDALCVGVVEESARYIALLITTTCQTLDFNETQNISVLTLGSLFRDVIYGELVQKSVKDAGWPELHLKMPQGTPASYGLRLAHKIWIRGVDK